MLARNEIDVALWRSAAARSRHEPWSPLRKDTRKRLSQGKRQSLIETVAGILKSGEPTVFALESSCRHGLRSGLCLDGWSWAHADLEAAEIVAKALRIIGAKRPTWLQGQPDWADTAPSARTVWEFTYCARCGKPLPEDDANRFYRRFCSRLCSTRTQSEKYQRDHKAEIAARMRARRAANPEHYREIQRRYLERKPEQQCPTCGTMFKLKRPKQTFCGLKCRPKPPGRWGEK